MGVTLSEVFVFIHFSGKLKNIDSFLFENIEKIAYVSTNSKVDFFTRLSTRNVRYLSYLIIN